jgi:outer membrane immunogenic protein
MRRTLLASIAALALASASSVALAADIPPPEPVANWTGFYLGAGGGLAWADLNIDHKRCLLDHHDKKSCDPYFDVFEREFEDTSDAGGVGIVQGGFDYQIGQYYVTGVGASWTFGDVLGDNDHRFHDDEFGFDHSLNHDNNSLVDVYFRSGFTPLPNLLVFGLAGWTFADLESNFRVRDDEGEVLFRNNDDFNADGPTFGVGLEWQFADWPLSLRAEYRFTDLENFDNNGRFEGEGDCRCSNEFRHRNDVDIDVQRVLFTLNWRFGGFGAATAAAY